MTFEFHILDETKNTMASFRNDVDRDNFIDLLREKYPDCKWYKADGEELIIQKEVKQKIGVI